MWWIWQQPKVLVDDDQEKPRFKVGSADERRLLTALREQLVGSSSSSSSSSSSGRGSVLPPDTILLTCLRGRKYDVKQAAALVPGFIALLAELEIRRPSGRLDADLRSGRILMPGTKDSAGRTVLWMRMRFHDPKATKASDIGRLVVACIVASLVRDADTSRCGVTILFDFTGIGEWRGRTDAAPSVHQARALRAGC